MRLPLLAVCLMARTVQVAPLRETEPEAYQTDDPAIWQDPKAPRQALIFGTVKMAAPLGAISVYRLDGKRIQRIEGLDRPNNIDVAYGFAAGGRTIDIAAATERNKSRLRLFRVVPGVGLEDAASLPVFEGETGPRAQPMGIALYTRRRDRALFAIVSRKNGPSGSYLWQYRLRTGADGKPSAEKVREFCAFGGTGEIEAVAVDREREHVYYSDEAAGIRKYHADPDHPEAGRELALFGVSGWRGDREGIAVHGGYIVATDQMSPESEFHVFSRDTLKETGVFRVGSAVTDGIEIGAGLFVAMNDSRRNFILADWKAIEAALRRSGGRR